MQDNIAPAERLDEVETHWEQRVHRLHSLYQHAAEQHRRMQAELDRDPDTQADAAYAVARARRLAIMAREEFFRSLKTYADLVVNRKAPPPEDDEHKLLLG